MNPKLARLTIADKCGFPIRIRGRVMTPEERERFLEAVSRMHGAIFPDTDEDEIAFIGPVEPGEEETP